MIPTIVDSLQGDLEKFTESLDISLLIEVDIKVDIALEGFTHFDSFNNSFNQATAHLNIILI